MQVMPQQENESIAMKINYAYNHNGWIATDEEGNTATSTFAEGKEKAAERLTDTIPKETLSASESVEDGQE